MNTFREKEDESGTGTCEKDPHVDQGLGRFPGSYAGNHEVFGQEEQLMKKKFIYAGIASLIFIPAISMAGEVEDQKIKTLDEVVVTATKTEETRKNVPNPVILYDEYDIDVAPALSIGELIANDPGIDWRIQGDAGGAAQTIHIRGMSTNATQVFVNGVNINSPSLGLAEVGRLPVNNIGNVEVVKGSGSLLYGTGAMGGTVNIFTKKPAKDKIDLRLNGGAGTNHSYHLGFENGLFFTKTLGYYLTANYDETEGFRSNSDLDHKDVSINLILNKGAQFDLSLYGQYIDREFGRPGVKPPEGTATYYIDGVAVYNSESASLLDRGGDEDGLFVLRADTRPNDKLNITLLGDISEMENYNSTRYTFGGPIDGYEAWTTNTIWEIEGDVDIIFSEKGDLLIGAEYISYDWENKTINLDGTGGKIDADLHSTGLYGELHYQLVDPLRILAGLRYEDNSGFGTETLPRFGLIVTPKQNIALKFSSGKHFRAPTLNDLYFPEDIYAKGNPDLQPETGWHSDITWEQSFRDDLIFFSASYFNWSLDDKIQWEPDSNGVFSPNNLRTFTGEGIELGAKLQLTTNLLIGFDYTYIDAEEESKAYTVMDYFTPYFEYNWVTRRAAYTPQNLFKGTVAYFTDFGMTVSAVLRYTDDRVTYRTEGITSPFDINTKTVEYTLDNYWTFDLKLVQQVKDHFYITLLGTNLFDEEFDTYLDSFTDLTTFTSSVVGYPGAGRSVFGKLEYRY